MSVDAETYIVISLMFAVFAAVAAVGSSMVLGAGLKDCAQGLTWCDVKADSSPMPYTNLTNAP